jgi:hypothetical protein
VVALVTIVSGGNMHEAVLQLALFFHELPFDFDNTLNMRVEMVQSPKAVCVLLAVNIIVG